MGLYFCAVGKYRTSYYRAAVCEAGVGVWGGRSRRMFARISSQLNELSKSTISLFVKNGVRDQFHFTRYVVDN